MTKRGKLPRVPSTSRVDHLHPTRCLRQYSDQQSCIRCGQSWDMNDAFPPSCTGHGINSFEPPRLMSRMRRAVYVAALMFFIPWLFFNSYLVGTHIWGWVNAVVN